MARHVKRQSTCASLVFERTAFDIVLLTQGRTYAKGSDVNSRTSQPQATVPSRVDNESSMTAS